jgi:GMP synthase (glutamine-hydrolysing)
MTVSAPDQAPSVLIVKLGDTLPQLASALGDFEHWIAQGLHSAGTPLHIEVSDPRPEPKQPATVHPHPPIHGLATPNPGLPLPQTLAHRRMGVVVTGSHAMVTDREPWSEATAAWLAEVVALGAPVLGICYGHQLLAHALGGEVWPHPSGLELGTIEVEPTAEAANDPLLGHLAQQGVRFAAQSAHRQSVRTLPPGATVLARNAFEPHHAYRVGHCAWGVQFHPEFGPDATRGYVQHLADNLHAQGDSAHSLQAQVRASPEAASVLARFTQLVARHASTAQPATPVHPGHQVQPASATPA